MTTVYRGVAPPSATLGTLPTFCLILPKPHRLRNRAVARGWGGGLL